MRDYYIEIEDYQNNAVAVVKVEAEDLKEAKYKALRALHTEDNLYEVDAQEAERYAKENGVYMIDENGEEVDYEDTYIE